jgi:hypothetical protein
MRSTKPADFPGKLPRAKNILARELTDAEMQRIGREQVETATPYELDDLDEDGKLSPSKRKS